MFERPNLNISFRLTIIEKLHKTNRNSTAVVIIYEEKLFKKGKIFFPCYFPRFLIYLTLNFNQQIVIWRGKLNYKLIGIPNQDIKENSEIKIILKAQHLIQL